MDCEMCGKQVGTRRYVVEGTVMNLGLECAKYGTPMDQPAAVGTVASMQQGLEKRARTMTSGSVYSSEADAWTLVDNFGPLVHKAREAKGLTHDQLGNKVSARVPELRQIEAGKLRPGDNLIAKLEKELNITLREKVEGRTQLTSQKQASGAGLTIGDLLKDAKTKAKK